MQHALEGLNRLQIVQNLLTYATHVLVPCASTVQYECEDIQGDAALFEALGVGLGRSEMVDVALAAKRLGQDPKRGVATVRCARIGGIPATGRLHTAVRPTMPAACKQTACWLHQ